MEKYRKFALQCGELYEGRRSAYFFEWAPVFIQNCSKPELKKILMEEGERVIDLFIDELKATPPRL